MNSAWISGEDRWLIHESIVNPEREGEWDYCVKVLTFLLMGKVRASREMLGISSIKDHSYQDFWWCFQQLFGNCLVDSGSIQESFGPCFRNLKYSGTPTCHAEGGGRVPHVERHAHPVLRTIFWIGPDLGRLRILQDKGPVLCPMGVSHCKTWQAFPCISPYLTKHLLVSLEIRVSGLRRLPLHF